MLALEGHSCFGGMHAMPIDCQLAPDILDLAAHIEREAQQR
jgi:hypothetical protein